MASKKTKQKIGIGDIVAFAKSGWTPGEVNNLLDRLDAIGDVTGPDPSDEEDDEINDPEDEDEDESDEDEDFDASDSNDTKNEEDDDDEVKEDKKKTSSKLSLLENENTRLKNQLAKLQRKNRTKDVSGNTDNSKTMEQSLIDTFQSLYD